MHDEEIFCGGVGDACNASNEEVNKKASLLHYEHQDKPFIAYY